jgi:TolB-like protein/Flp pilus assembly protein TadD
VKTFFKEARRRKVFRMTALYVVAAWVAIQVAGEAFDAFAMPEAALRQIWVVALLGFPLFLIFSWYYDIGSKGIVRTPPANPDEYTDLSLGKADYIIISVMLVFVVLISFPLIDEISKAKTDRQSLTSVREAPPNSIAVLPFLNLSGEKNNEYFSDGISEELLNKLAHLSGLRVAARTSSFYFKGKDEQIPLIAAQLGVRTILEGSVRKAGNKVRVTVQLINASDGYHLWSKNFDRELGDIFAIQDEIATQVVDALKVTLLGSEASRLSHHSTENIDAYNAYLLGRQRMAQRTSTTLHEAVEYFDKAIDLDPAFALAYVGLADAYNHLATWGTLSRDDALAKAEPAVTRALQLDDQLGEAYAALGFVLQRKQDRDGAQAAYKKAIELNPSYADSYQRYGVLLKWDFGRVEDALPLHKKALELDPLSTSLNMSVAEDYHEMGRYEEALKQCQRVIEIDPDFPRAYSLMADLYWEVFGRVDEGARWLRKAVELDQGNPSHARWLAMVYLDLGDLDAATYWLDKAIASATDQTHTKWTQLLFAYYEGDRKDVTNAAMALLKQAPENGWGLTALRDADLDAGRADLAVERYQLAYPDLLVGDDPAVKGFAYGSAIEVALALIETGNNERAEMLLNKSLAAIEAEPRLGYAGFGVSDAEIYALLGDKQQALATLRQAIDEGWRAFWWMALKKNRNLASLHEEPEYQAMVAELETEMAGQLARVRAMGLTP